MFGVIFKRIKSKSVPSYQQFVDEVLKAYCYSPFVSVISVPAIFDYKIFYDQFIDPRLKILKEDYTQHGWRVQKLSVEEARDFPILSAGVKTNYRKSAQTVSFV